LIFSNPAQPIRNFLAGQFSGFRHFTWAETVESIREISAMSTASLSVQRPATILPPVPLSPVKPRLKESPAFTVEPGKDDVSVSLPSTSDWLVQTADSPVSAGFVAQVKQGWQSIPERVQSALVRHGWTVKVGQFMTKIDARLKHAFPRGGDPGTTADHRGGMCIPRHIFLTEYQWLQRHQGPSKFAKSKTFPCITLVQPPVESSQGILACSTARDRTMRHEAGHAVDHLLRNPSVSTAFHQEYMKDFAKMDAERTEELYYYIQPDADGQPSRAGKSEAFADAFASLYGGGCNQTAHFQENFPHVVDFVKHEMDAFEDRQGELPSAWSKGPPVISGIKRKVDNAD
jgi:hypothetical protein